MGFQHFNSLAWRPFLWYLLPTRRLGRVPAVGRWTGQSRRYLGRGGSGRRGIFKISWHISINSDFQTLCRSQSDSNSAARPPIAPISRLFLFHFAVVWARPRPSLLPPRSSRTFWPSPSWTVLPVCHATTVPAGRSTFPPPLAVFCCHPSIPSSVPRSALLPSFRRVAQSRPPWYLYRACVHPHSLPANHTSSRHTLRPSTSRFCPPLPAPPFTLSALALPRDRRLHQCNSPLCSCRSSFGRPCHLP
jgi:hypothetical protein